MKNKQAAISIPFGVKVPVIDADAPWRWLNAAAMQYRREWLLCAGFGLTFVLVGYSLVYLFARSGLVTAFPIAIGAFALVGPLLACGIYGVARAHEDGRRPTMTELVLPKAASPGQVALIGIAIMIALFVWIVAGMTLYVVAGGEHFTNYTAFQQFFLNTYQGLAMATAGTIVGGLIAAIIFAITAFSLPMVMDQRVDAISAVSLSAATVLRNLKPMLLWAWLIALSVVISAATLLAGFVVFFPLFGLATWIGYRETFA
ncbi:DUF2189 domain-containing protein [Parvularcula sp. LCG005]|uniref:DUF2189 domain-containing protein n=1 Tax=Parvularcula sp. LCG005 TaxID=3078805 RepID=UPI0029436B4D|nr:DUF2189 domain-containing protein [Parvularcula sp. LCG005]WOI54166.1 DUF2189 domain-containing protein [Parvularcula sp. LCG005]